MPIWKDIIKNWKDIINIRWRCTRNGILILSNFKKYYIKLIIFTL